MPRFSSRTNTSALKARRPSIGIMLMLSVPAAIMISAAPVRMRSAAIDTAFRPDEQKRFTVMPATVFGSPARRSPMRATFMPCSYSGIAQPTITSSIRAGSICGTCVSTRLSTCASSESGRVCRKAPRGALPTGVRVAATMLASCSCLVILTVSKTGVAFRSIPQRLARLERVHDAFLRLRVPEQRHELAPFEVEEPLFVDQAPRFHVAAAEHARDDETHLEIVRGDESAVAHVDEHHLQRRDAGSARDRDTGKWRRRPVCTLG